MKKKNSLILSVVTERNIKLVLEYDGGDFYGFQKQPHHPTVQETLETALSRLFNREMKIQAASGRTDTGVHAEYQVVNFRVKSHETVEKIQRGLNGILPKSIVVKEIEEVSPDFHARYSAKDKTYEYLIWNHPVRSPLWRRRVCHIKSKLSLAQMRKAAKSLTGKHDFRAFCASGSLALEKNTVRHVMELRILKRGALIRVRVKANGFLYHMVRNIAGTLIEVGLGKLDSKGVRKILQSCDRRNAGVTAPAEALTLLAVTY